MVRETRIRRIQRMVDDRLVQACEQLRIAMRQHERLACLYAEQVLVFCPQILGHRPDGPYVLAVVIAGDPDLRQEGLRSPRRLRWLSVADMWGLFRTPGAWVSAPRHGLPAIDNFTVETECA
jgi:hypothetical protein